jgi:hypothetical protein
MIVLDADMFGEIPEGWGRVIERLDGEIAHSLDSFSAPYSAFSVYCVKEKFGSLNIYYSLDHEHFLSEEDAIECIQEIDTYIDAAERECYFTCVVCGAPTNLVSKGYILPYCHDHFPYHKHFATGGDEHESIYPQGD